MELTSTLDMNDMEVMPAIYSLFTDDIASNVTVSDTINDMESHSKEYISQHLTELNYEFMVLMIPAITFLTILMSVGVIGNILVLYVYLSKFKPSTIRCYVLSLAVCDLLSCCISIPGELVDISFNYTFNIASLCKLLRSVNAFTTFSSGLILIVVAVDRYRKICTPFRKQFSIQTANVVVIVCCLCSLLLSLPASILYGSKTVSTDIPSVNGTDCSTSDTFIGTIYPLIYNGVQFLFFTLGSIVLTTLYSLIGKRIWRHKVIRNSGLNTGRKPVRISSTTGTDGSSPVTEVVQSRSKRLSRMISTESNPEALLSKSRRTDNRKTTLMLFLITVIFIVSFLPHLILMTLKALDKNSLSGSGGLSELAHNILLRSYFINSASNPIIYSFCSFKFRNECQRIFRCRK